MRSLKALTFGLAVWAVTSSPAFADVQLTIQNGRVSLVAKDATIRQILTEWARIGQTKIVNVERITGGPLTLQLTNVSEQQALEVLLRSVSGYMLAPRPVPAPNLSQFDRIVVMPTSVPPRTTAASPAPSPVFQQPQLPQLPAASDENDVLSPNIPGLPRGPLFPQPQVVNPQQSAVPTLPTPTPATGGGAQQQPTTTVPAVFPGAPTTPATPSGGVPVPGMVAPNPQQPGQQPAARPATPEGN